MFLFKFLLQFFSVLLTSKLVTDLFGKAKQKILKQEDIVENFTESRCWMEHRPSEPQINWGPQEIGNFFLLCIVEFSFRIGIILVAAYAWQVRYRAILHISKIFEIQDWKDTQARLINY